MNMQDMLEKIDAMSKPKNKMTIPYLPPKPALKVLAIKNEHGAQQLEKLLVTGWNIVNVAANNAIIVYILRK